MLLRFVERPTHAHQQHIAEADDRVERCAQLVRHHRQELRLETRRLFCSLVRALKLGRAIFQSCHQIVQAQCHAIEGIGQLTEFIAAAHVDFVIKVAARDMPRRLCQFAQRIGHSTDDDH